MKRPSGLTLRFRCEEDWRTFDETAAGEGTRLCQKCVKRVHDLTTLTRAEALALFERPPPEGLCVRYREDGHGRILFRSERYPGYLAWKRFQPPPLVRRRTTRDDAGDALELEPEPEPEPE